MFRIHQDEESTPSPVRNSCGRRREVAPFFCIPNRGKARHEALERLRQWLLAVVGSEVELELLLDLVDEQKSYEDVASMLQFNRAEVWRLVQRAHHLIRWAAVAERTMAEHERGRQVVILIDPTTALPLTRHDRKGFVVSLPNASQTIDEPSVEAVGEYIQQYSARVLRSRDEKIHLACWLPLESPSLILDLVVLIDHEAMARILAHRWRQDTIYSLDTHEELVVRPRGRRAA